MKTTLVLGASEHRERYSYRAIINLLAQDIDVIAIGAREGEINGTPIITGMPALTDVHTVTLYLAPRNQKMYYDYIIQLKPQRIIFNPGTENPELKALADQHGIYTEEACTLILLSLRTY